MNRLRFVSFSSGSDGNCYYVGNASRGILIDAGVAGRTLKKRMKEVGIDFPNILGVFITHDHYDHIKGVCTLHEKYNLPIYSTPTVFDGINHNYGLKGKIYDGKHIEKGVPFSIGNFTIEAFEVSHDGHDNMGYCIQYAGKKLVIATDLGCIEQTQAKYFKDADILVIEANYDDEMLENGSYPEHLKRRIRGRNGHLCNDETADFLSQNAKDTLTHIFLCHLSKSNNTPEKAQQCVSEKVRDGIHVIPLPRTSLSEMYIFD